MHTRLALLYTIPLSTLYCCAALQASQLQGLGPQDDLSSLLEALAAVFAVRPGLWYDGEAPEAYPHVSSFMSYVSHQFVLIC
jgi:hypothetical protein